MLFLSTLALTCVVTDDLVSKKRYAEAATVLLDYAGDVRQAVIAYVEGNFFADARRIVSGLPPLLRWEVDHFLGLGISPCRVGTDGRDHPPRRTRNQIATGRRSGRDEVSAFETSRSYPGA